MLRNNSVIFKGRRDGITILLDPDTEFEEIKSVLSEKLIGAERFFGDAKTSISFKGRELTDDEENELLALVLSKTRLTIGFLGEKTVRQEEYLKEEHLTEEPNVPSREQRQDELQPEEKTQEEERISTKFVPYPDTDKLQYDMAAHFCRTSVRSGQSIRFNGSVIVMGDVNPGAEIFAAGNVIVFGTLKGLVHAGCKGDVNAYVSALCLQPVQLRIADIYTYIPIETVKGKKKIQPAYAYIEGDKIFIEPFTE